MNKEEALNDVKQRVKIIRSAMNFKKTERIPVYCNTQNWAVIDAGYTVLEAARDYEKCYDAQRKFAEKYNYDFGLMAVRNPTQLYDALGQNSTWAATNDENSINAIFEDEMIKADEYDEMINNYEKIIWEKAMFRTFPKSKDFNIDQFENAAEAASKFIGARRNAAIIMREEYGRPEYLNILQRSCFIGNLMNTYRGLKGLSMDLRRQPAKVQELCDMQDEIWLTDFEKKMAANPGPDMNEPFDVQTGFLAHILLTVKQFEIFYGKAFKRLAGACQKYGKQMLNNTEADFIRFGDFFNDFDKGVVNNIVEMDNPFELRKKFPNIGIVGGLSVDIMGNATTKQCIDMAKKAIDEIGCDGGLILSPNKFVTYNYDMKSENLIAVCDFAYNYNS